MGSWGAAPELGQEVRRRGKRYQPVSTERVLCKLQLSEEFDCMPGIP